MAFSNGKTPRGLREALRFLTASRRTPTDDDRPPPSPFPGRRPHHVDGQLSLEETDDDRAA
jgi:hypothetical protein